MCVCFVYVACMSVPGHLKELPRAKCMPVVNLRYQAMLVYNKRDAFQNPHRGAGHSTSLNNRPFTPLAPCVRLLPRGRGQRHLGRVCWQHMLPGRPVLPLTSCVSVNSSRFGSTGGSPSAALGQNLLALFSAPPQHSQQVPRTTLCFNDLVTSFRVSLSTS